MLIFTGCSAAHSSISGNGMIAPRDARKAIDAWIKQEKLRPATNREVSYAKLFKEPIQGPISNSPNGRLSLEFIRGDAKAQGDMFTSTSIYRLIDSETGRVLLSVPSIITSEKFENPDYPPTQSVWFLPDGRVLLYELRSDGATYHDSVILLYPTAEATYLSRFISLPDIFPYPGLAGEGAVPIGVFRDSILFRPSGDTRILKRRIQDMPPAPAPLPFGIG